MPYRFGIVAVYWLFSRVVIHLPWDGYTIGVSLAMGSCLFLLLAGIPYLMEKSRKAFRFGAESSRGSAVLERLEEGFCRRRERLAILVLVVLPFLILNAGQVITGGLPFFGDEGTAVSVLLDLFNYLAGYLILALFALVVWLVYTVCSTLLDMGELPLRKEVPVEVHAVDGVGGLGTVQEFIRNLLTYYFVVVALLILSYLHPEHLWSYEMFFVVILFLIGILFFFHGLGTLRNLVRGKIKEMSENLNRSIHVQQEKLCSLSSGMPDDSTGIDIGRIKDLLDAYHTEHQHLVEMYRENRAYDLRTVGQVVASFIVPLLVFIEQITSAVTSVKTLMG